MDQVKIGRFIAERRKSAGLTQMQLAEKLGITDRAVSKWETGKSMPDSSVMLELCEILGITVNDLLSGEEVSMENYNEQSEKNLLEAIKQKEQADKRLLKFEVVMMIISSVFLLTMLAVGTLLARMQVQSWLCFVIIGIGIVQFLVAALFAVKIEQVAGYYECAKCGHRYVPSYAAVNMAMHMGRTRYLKCPHCHQSSWQKKVIEKEIQK